MYTIDIKVVEKELEAIHVDQAKGAQIRSKVNWIENGEKNSNTF